MTAILLLPAGLPLARVPGAPVGDPTVPSAASSTAEATAVPAGRPAGGITVHGQWTIEVFEPDGRLVSRHEFENALVTPTGPVTLAKFLARTASTGKWNISLGGSASSLPCDNGAGTPVSCDIRESWDPVVGNNTFKTLTISEGAGSDAGKVVLGGQATAQRDGAIAAVATFVQQCPATTAPATPCDETLYALTSKAITSVPVTDGQQIQVTVKLGFS